MRLTFIFSVLQAIALVRAGGSNSTYGSIEESFPAILGSSAVANIHPTTRAESVVEKAFTPVYFFKRQTTTAPGTMQTLATTMNDETDTSAITPNTTIALLATSVTTSTSTATVPTVDGLTLIAFERAAGVDPGAETGSETGSEAGVEEDVEEDVEEEVVEDGADRRSGHHRAQSCVFSALYLDNSYNIVRLTCDPESTFGTPRQGLNDWSVTILSNGPCEHIKNKSNSTL
ncbi:hypothetical protein F53441_6468 [Fusarium austroafricanum]|uniref:Uncharacterized protein n=1 Tax=Fusarium austroafricanum TaxID=2364996 RepID=A0A8H4KIS9_9HYPO|nr:hypothetical protein F53441_6468 [Fusarium austroafricanum]